MARWCSLARALSFVVLFGTGSACATGGHCEWETWDGPCVLQSVKRVRSVERFPRSYVVVEALYTPADVTSVGAPPSIRVEHSTDARHEYDLMGHLQAHANTQCGVRVLDESVCGSPEMTAKIPDFHPRAVARTEGPKGCALLEHDPQREAAASEPIDETLEFPEGAATPTPAIRAAVSRIATKMIGDPSIQCVALSGQNAFGEEFRLADERARAVQQLLVERGIATERLRVFSAVLPTYAGTSAMERVADPEHRRVQLTIVARSPAP